MAIVSLQLENFRTYYRDSFEFSEGVSIIVGPNASGKTNLLEAILLLCEGQSFRAKDHELISHEKDYARIEGLVGIDKRVVLIEHDGIERSTKTHQINTQNLKRLPPAKRVPVVLFEPEILQLFQGGPERRREYMDSLISRTTPGFNTIMRQYRRVLSQRNALLKRHQTPKQEEFFAWDVRLSELGGQIATARKQLIDTLNSSINEEYQNIASKNNNVSLEYLSKISSPSYNTHMLHALEKVFQIDRERGYTSVGPHRDDLQVLFDGKDAKQVASRGEMRSLVLALKVLELKILEAAVQKQPILLLDDVFSELDGARRKALTESIQQYQTFITTTDADLIVKYFIGACEIIPTNRAV